MFKIFALFSFVTSKNRQFFAIFFSAKIFLKSQHRSPEGAGQNFLQKIKSGIIVPNELLFHL
jgi:hypothetical protein